MGWGRRRRNTDTQTCVSGKRREVFKKKNTKERKKEGKKYKGYFFFLPLWKCGCCGEREGEKRGRTGKRPQRVGFESWLLLRFGKKIKIKNKGGEGGRERLEEKGGAGGLFSYVG